MICEKCKTEKATSLHHIHPKCFFGRIGALSALCANCHQEIEAIYELFEGKKNNRRIRLTREKYTQIFNDWITEKLWRKK